MSFIELGQTPSEPDKPIIPNNIGYLECSPHVVYGDIRLDNEIVVPHGSLRGDFHFQIPNGANAYWRTLTPLQRAQTAAFIALEGLLEHAERNMEEKTIDFYHGYSHFVKPTFFRKLGFTVSPLDPAEDEEVAYKIREKLETIYGDKIAGKMRVGKIFEFWATPAQMISALPLLREKKDMIQRRMQKRSPISA